MQIRKVDEKPIHVSKEIQKKVYFCYVSGFMFHNTVKKKEDREKSGSGKYQFLGAAL